MVASCVCLTHPSGASQQLYASSTIAVRILLMAVVGPGFRHIEHRLVLAAFSMGSVIAFANADAP